MAEGKQGVAEGKQGETPPTGSPAIEDQPSTAVLKAGPGADRKFDSSPNLPSSPTPPKDEKKCQATEDHLDDPKAVKEERTRPSEDDPRCER